MGEIDNARAQREALDNVTARRAAGVERSYGGLHTYLAALLYKEERKEHAEETDTGTDPEQPEEQNRARKPR
jgi:hypothetical protein